MTPGTSVVHRGSKSEKLVRGRVSRTFWLKLLRARVNAPLMVTQVLFVIWECFIGQFRWNPLGRKLVVYCFRVLEKSRLGNDQFLGLNHVEVVESGCKRGEIKRLYTYLACVPYVFRRVHGGRRSYEIRADTFSICE